MDDSINRLANQLVEPTSAGNLISRFKPHAAVDAPLVAGVNDFDTQPTLMDRTPADGSYFPNNRQNAPSPAPRRSEEQQIVLREQHKREVDNNERHNFIPITPPRNESARHFAEAKQGAPRRRQEVEFEAVAVKPDLADSSIDLQERSRFYESLMELYVGFIGIQVISSSIFFTNGVVRLSSFTLILFSPTSLVAFSRCSREHTQA